MFRNLYPDIYVDSAYAIDYESLYADGYRGLIYDIDNTLVHHGAPANERAIALFRRLRSIGFKCCFISNNDEERVRMFNQDIHAFYTYKAHKPQAGGYLKAMEAMDTGMDDTIFIGDQLFTDVWGANRVGIPAIMVKYIYRKERFTIFLKRRLETVVLICYRIYRRRHKSTARGGFFTHPDAGRRRLGDQLDGKGAKR